MVHVAGHASHLEHESPMTPHVLYNNRAGLPYTTSVLCGVLCGQITLAPAQICYLLEALENIVNKLRSSAASAGNPWKKPEARFAFL